MKIDQFNDNDWIKNIDLSSNGYTTYNIFDLKKDTIAEKTSGMFISPELINKENVSFISTETSGKMVFYGLYKNNKPFAGFFTNMIAMENEWLMLDFYEEGELVYQLYSDAYEAFKIDDSVYDTLQMSNTLSNKNTFCNSVLTNGIEISFEPQIARGLTTQIVRYVKDEQTDYFYMGFFGMHFGELFKIQKTKHGYLFESFQKDKASIEFTDNGRCINIFDNQNTLIKSIDSKYYPLSESKNQTKDGVYSYFINDGKIAISEDLMSEKSIDETMPNRSELIPMFVANFFYKFKDITTEDLLFFAQKLYWDKSEFMGYYIIDKGKHIGALLESDNTGTYTMSHKDTDESISVILEKKTLEEIYTWINDATRDE